MKALDLWITFSYNQACEKYLIDVWDNNFQLRPVSYTYHDGGIWNFTPEEDIYSYLYDIHNIMVF